MNRRRGVRTTAAPRVTEPALPRIVDDALRRPVAAPDLSRPIMGRLGFMRAAPAVVRRDRMWRAVRRSTYGLALCTVAAISVIAHRHGPWSANPTHPTLPAAIGEDIHDHHEHLRNVFRTIRTLTPADGDQADPKPPSGDSQVLPAVDDDVNRSAVAPVRWV